MEFPLYYLYENAIAARNGLVLLVSAVTLLAGMGLWTVSRYKPTWISMAAWITVGGYYATFCAVAVYFLSRS